MIHRIALIAAALAGAGAAAAEPVAPSQLVEAFNQTCRRGFPDFETIKARPSPTAGSSCRPARSRHRAGAR